MKKSTNKPASQMLIGLLLLVMLFAICLAEWRTPINALRPAMITKPIVLEGSRLNQSTNNHQYLWNSKH
ncbi:MAG: hypothetical protein ACHQHN_13940 [Sphingobacteriales bacterium]